MDLKIKLSDCDALGNAVAKSSLQQKYNSAQNGEYVFGNVYFKDNIHDSHSLPILKHKDNWAPCSISITVG